MIEEADINKSETMSANYRDLVRNNIVQAQVPKILEMGIPVLTEWKPECTGVEACECLGEVGVAEEQVFIDRAAHIFDFVGESEFLPDKRQARLTPDFRDTRTNGKFVPSQALSDDAPDFGNVERMHGERRG